MTPDDRRFVKDILGQHDEIARHLRDASEAFDRAMVGLRDMMTAIHEANEAQRGAIDHMIAANKAALRLFNEAPE